MNNQTDDRPAVKDDALIASFHRVESLIPVNQELVAVPPEMRVSDALEIMQTNHYSQLPVVAGEAVLGVFSYRSFSSKALAKQKSARESLGELPVEEFLENFEYVHSAEDWNQVLRYLNQDDAFFVGHRDALDGMVTTMDLLNYFREIANPFIMIAEIELSLRQIIQTCIDSSKIEDAIQRSLHSAYPGRPVPTDLLEMTFDNLAQIISNGTNWPHFKPMFGEQEKEQKRTNEKLRQIGKWRNTVFHFRHKLENWELETLTEYREWLHRRVRAFEGRRREKTGRTILPESHQVEPTREDYLRFLTRRNVPDGQRQLYRALFQAGGRGLNRDELVEAMGRRDRYDLAGVFGAIGNRVNNTPGYGKTYRPGLDMVLIRHRTMDGERLTLADGLLTVLKDLHPDWLIDDTG
jgi:predicted transcriptional regulator